MSKTLACTSVETTSHTIGKRSSTGSTVADGELNFLAYWAGGLAASVTTGSWVSCHTQSYPYIHCIYLRPICNRKAFITPYINVNRDFFTLSEYQSRKKYIDYPNFGVSGFYIHIFEHGEDGGANVRPFPESWHTGGRYKLSEGARASIQ